MRVKMDEMEVEMHVEDNSTTIEERHNETYPDLRYTSAENGMLTPLWRMLNTGKTLLSRIIRRSP